ncbi:hypothetical protein [Stakelama tenebrarum]|uniref:Uncharacterized protein n=1 Tax=Stakelama tenebrarum TaxID=2711215 RepID=A0A6G6Y2Q6_9SPHN|nr:hypothetical protein [Sphingosinithalassobacter tenebrarum]QIG79087.1 hypothetical protein G5C33_04330 [Sphingosinithalassobacter tenebrarum]
MQEKLWAWGGGLATFALAGLAYLSVGQIYSGAKAIDLIGQLTQSALYFGSAIATSSATTLALMLTLIGMAHRSEAEFDDDFYRNIYHIAVLATGTLAGAVLLLLMLTMPVGEFDGLSSFWFIWLYRVLFAMVGLLSALLVATVMLVFMTIRRVITGITPTDAV